jgi:probable F420-dependent oxidoreductase
LRIPDNHRHNLVVMDGPRGRTGILLGSWPLGLPAEGRFYIDIAQQVEAAGYDLLFVGDHLFMYNPNPAPFAVLATFAAVTAEVKVGTAVLLLPLRDPVVTAKEIATIDYLSGGRVILGVGAGGDIEQEWRAMEVPLSSRGARTDEYLQVLRQFWSGAPMQHHGRFRNIEGVVGSPLPAQPGGPPVWIGGRSDAALRRAGRWDGWCAYAVSTRRLRESIAKLREFAGRDLPPTYRVSCVVFATVDDRVEIAREKAGAILRRRYRQDFDHFLDHLCAVGDPDTVAARLEAYRDAGADDLLLVPQAPAEEVPEQIWRLAEILRLPRRAERRMPLA